MTPGALLLNAVDAAFKRAGLVPIYPSDTSARLRLEDALEREFRDLGDVAICSECGEFCEE